MAERSMRSGYPGVDNPLFYDPGTAMLFGDAKASILDITAELKALADTRPDVGRRLRPSAVEWAGVDRGA